QANRLVTLPTSTYNPYTATPANTNSGVAVPGGSVEVRCVSVCQLMLLPALSRCCQESYPCAYLCQTRESLRRYDLFSLQPSNCGCSTTSPLWAGSSSYVLHVPTSSFHRWSNALSFRLVDGYS